MDNSYLSPQDQQAYIATQNNQGLGTTGMPEGSQQGFNFGNLVKNVGRGLVNMNRGAQGMGPLASPRNPYGEAMAPDQNDDFITRMKNFPSTVSKLWQ